MLAKVTHDNKNVIFRKGEVYQYLFRRRRTEVVVFIEQHGIYGIQAIDMDRTAFRKIFKPLKPRSFPKDA